MTNSRDQILNMLLPRFPEIGGAGVYFSKKLNAEIGVAGNQIFIEFYEKRPKARRINKSSNGEAVKKNPKKTKSLK